MQLFINAFTNYSALELTTFILGMIAIIVAITLIALTFKKETNKIYKIFSHIVLPVLSITLWFALLFLRINTFSPALSFVVAFGIAVCCELLAFGVTILVCRNKEQHVEVESVKIEEEKEIVKEDKAEIEDEIDEIEEITEVEEI